MPPSLQASAAGRRDTGYRDDPPNLRAAGQEVRQEDEAASAAVCEGPDPGSLDCISASAPGHCQTNVARDLLSACLCESLSPLSNRLSVYGSIWVSFHLFFVLSAPINPFIHPSIHLAIDRSLYLLYLSVYPLRLSICLSSIYPSILLSSYRSEPGQSGLSSRI